MLNAIQKIHQLGQSIWYDNIERRLLKNGEMKKLIESGVSGITTNPSIFEKAVASSSDYDEQIISLASAGKNPREIYDELTIQDVLETAELLTDVFRTSGGRDGYVSIEVWPEYAHNAAKTIDYARRIWQKINKKNIMIKVPGTKEGPEAISALIGEGINVNVTLLFSEEQYQAVARAYLDGLKTRLKKGGEISPVNSVASVFVSRIDTKIDHLLTELTAPIAESLKGKVAVAYMKTIYQAYKKIFFLDNFAPLLKQGANIQRILWASTSTKNPAYHDLLYVEPLIGPNSVNTLPPATLKSLIDYGKTELNPVLPEAGVEKNLDQAHDILNRLSSLNIDITSVCQKIQDEGVKAFQDSFDKLIKAVEIKTKTVSA